METLLSVPGYDFGWQNTYRFVEPKFVPGADSAAITVWARGECFHALRDRAVDPDRPEEHGRIPGKASCVFCGARLPIVSKQAYCLNVGEFSPPRQFWVHAGEGGATSPRPSVP